MITILNYKMHPERLNTVSDNKYILQKTSNRVNKSQCGKYPMIKSTVKNPLPGDKQRN